MDQGEAIRQIGRVVAEYRGRLGQVFTQEKLAEALELTRTKVAHLEEGRELPAPDELRKICRKLAIPDRLWVVGTHPFFVETIRFEALLSELIGRQAQHGQLEGVDQLRLAERVQGLMAPGMTENQAHAQFNTVMVLYGERPVTCEFFSHYLSTDAFASLTSFEDRIRRYQADAMRLYGNFRRAWTRLSRVSPLKSELTALESIQLAPYFERSPFIAVRDIPPERLPQLGYIAVNRIKEEVRVRNDLATCLQHLADAVDKKGTEQALRELPAKRKRRMQTLLRKLDIDGIELEHGLFYRIDAELLRAEARRITPEEKDLIQIEETQQQGLMNLSAYLTEPHMDVYVATSMRDDADFVSVNAFALQLFEHSNIKPLKLRYFNPTQSWIGDRVSKGLVEALMLRRSKVTVYMAQKTDTFGKDSEASVALGQGKTVIVYVPRVFDQDGCIDSEQLYRMNEKELDQALAAMGLETEEGTDRRAKARFILQSQLKRLSPTAIKRVVFNHWADFDLYGELVRIADKNLRDKCYHFLRGVRTAESLEKAPNPDTEELNEMADRLTAIADAFESRAVTFREIHPLSLQVIVRSGVVNGILVTRSVNSCAKVLKGVIENTLEMAVVVEECNYKLVEKETQSTLRVVSRHHLLTNAFWSQYFEDGPRMIDAELLDASTI